MPSPGDTPESSPCKAGLDGERLSALSGWLDELPGSNIHAVVVVRHGLLAFELYRSGADQRWREPLADTSHGPDTLHDLRSVTKSIVGLLIGIAVDRGLFPDLDTPVFQILAEYADLRTREKGRITLRHLLTMSSGLAWDENLPADDPRHGEMRLWEASDRLRAALDPPLVDEPGTNWNYSGGSTELLGAVLERASGSPIDEFARETLFEPLGIREVEWARHRDGRPSASGGLRMGARALAKVGHVVVAGGRWNNTHIVPSTWISESLTPQIGAPDRLFFYGYHWWLGRSLLSGREVAWASGIGLGGQRLFCVPEFGLVCAITAGHYGDAMQAWLPLTVLNRFVLPAIDRFDGH